MEYRKKYEMKRVVKSISFNRENKEELEMLNYANDQLDFSKTVKKWIKEELEKAK